MDDISFGKILGVLLHQRSGQQPNSTQASGRGELILMHDHIIQQHQMRPKINNLQSFQPLQYTAQEPVGYLFAVVHDFA